MAGSDRKDLGRLTARACRNHALANLVDWTLVLPEEEECSSAHNTTSGQSWDNGSFMHTYRRHRLQDVGPVSHAGKSLLWSTPARRSCL